MKVVILEVESGLSLHVDDVESFVYPLRHWRVLWESVPVPVHGLVPVLGLRQVLVLVMASG
jgi:hypothetical protein